MSNSPEIHGANIVLRGSFTPAIFQPSWLASQKLIGNKEAEAAKIEIIHPQATIFSAEWLQLRVLEDRFQASTYQEAFFEPLRDLVSGVFDILSHTPIKALGLNQDFHFRLSSESKWHSVGDRLAPKEDWKEILDKPGMRALVMHSLRPDSYKGSILVQVEPSLQITPYGLFVNINDHYLLGETEESEELPKASKIPLTLSKAWSSSILRGETIAKKIASIGE
jgi:hypothetical protein